MQENPWAQTLVLGEKLARLATSAAGQKVEVRCLSLSLSRLESVSSLASTRITYYGGSLVARLDLRLVADVRRDSQSLCWSRPRRRCLGGVAVGRVKQSVCACVWQHVW